MINMGNVITNTISTGAGADELYLTFTFEWDFPDMQEGSLAETKRKEKLIEEAAYIVPHTIDQIRNMVREGKL
jgi:Domain of unknown function (DUF1857)